MSKINFFLQNFFFQNSIFWYFSIKPKSFEYVNGVTRQESSGSSEDQDYYDDYVEYGENNEYDYNGGTTGEDPTAAAEEETTTQGKL